MKIKTKLSLGLIFLFLMILMTGGLGVWYLRQLAADAKNILKDNYETLDYTKKMLEFLEIPDLAKDNNASITSSSFRFNIFEQNLVMQEHNISEVGEKEATEQLRNEYEQFKKDLAQTHFDKMRQQIYQIMDLNMHAIVRKNEVAQRTANDATQLLSFVLAFVFLAAFTFIFNFPNYIAEPISELTNGIRAIANKNYEQRLHFKSNDEFGELANAFNTMAEKLNNYENSNLAKLLFEKQRIETIINNMNDAIIGLDEGKNILFVNQVATRLLGMSEYELIGKYAADVALTNDLLRNLLKNDSIGSPLKIFADDKESYFTKELLEVKNVEKNTTAGTVIILKNITKFQELDLAKTNFIATISHELKTPIAAIKMSLKLLEDDRIGSVNEEQKKLIHLIKDDSQRLLKITGELLDLTQVESGKIQLNQQLTTPKAIIQYATNAVKTLAEQKKVQLNVVTTDEFIRVNADVEKTAWVMVNLLSNAIRYSPEEGKIIISTIKNNGKVQFSVQDFGKGIDEKFTEKIFDKFFQIPINGSQDTAGTGLGLAISKDFIEAQGGKIWVVSEVHRGSNFIFSLPVA